MYFSEPTYSRRGNRADIRPKPGAEVLVLDGVHSQSGVNAEKDYFEMMYANLGIVKDRFGGQIRER